MIESMRDRQPWYPMTADYAFTPKKDRGMNALS